jgi:hypothetical protein
MPVDIQNKFDEVVNSSKLNFKYNIFTAPLNDANMF